MNPAQACAQVLVDELVRLGVRHVVLAPGSRSAPLAYAAHAADRAGRLTLHVRIDERSAAFLALGLGKLTAVPAAVVTTSGTAVANLHPAVLEAHEAAVPLLLLTADRPPELRGTRANQTTDQPGLFGRAVRLAHDLGVPERRPGQAAAWRTAADRAYAAAVGALGGTPGPAHLNVPLRDPLVPDLVDPDPMMPPAEGWHSRRDAESSPSHGGARQGAWVADADSHADSPADRPGDRAGVDDLDADGSAGGRPGAWPERLDGRPGGRPWTGFAGTTPGGTEPAPAPSTGQAADGTGGLTHVPRTLVVLGDAPPSVLRETLDAAAALGYPVLAEPFGRRPPPPGAGALPHGSLLLAGGLGDPGAGGAAPSRPDRILVIGRLTLTRAVATLLRTPGMPVELVATQPRWPDPGHVVELVHPPGALARLAAAPTGAPTRAAADDFRAAWAAAAGAVGRAVTSVLADAWPSGPALAATVLAALPADAVLFLGSSTGVRDVEVVRAADRAEIVASRGLAGIDGCVSTAAGISLAAPGRPAYALLGDLTFLHDANGLLAGPREPRPDLTLVVANDDGGGIFGTLEYGEPDRLARDPDAFERLFATPTRTRIGPLCAAHGARHLLATRPGQVAAAVAARPDGLTVVEVPLPRRAARGVHGRLSRAARRALGGA